MGQQLQKIQGKHLGKSQNCELCQQKFENPLKFGIFYKKSVKAHLCRRCGRYVCIKCAKKKVIIGFKDSLPHTFCNICQNESQYNQGLIDCMDNFGKLYLKYIKKNLSENTKKDQSFLYECSQEEIGQHRENNMIFIKKMYKNQNLESSGYFISGKSLIIEEYPDINIGDDGSKMQQNGVQNQIINSPDYPIQRYNYNIKEFLYILQEKYSIDNMDKLKELISQSLLQLNGKIDMLDIQNSLEIYYIIPILLGFTEYEVENMVEIFSYILDNILQGLYRKNSHIDFIELESQFILEQIINMFQEGYIKNKLDEGKKEDQNKIKLSKQLTQQEINTIVAFLNESLPIFLKSIMLNCLGIKCIHYLWASILQNNSILILEQCIQSVILINIDIILQNFEVGSDDKNDLQYIYTLILRNTTLDKLQSQMYKIEQLSDIQQNLKLSLISKKSTEIQKKQSFQQQIPQQQIEEAEQ